MQRMFTTVKPNEMPPITAKSFASSPLPDETVPVWRKIAYTKQIPEFTAGGRSDAEIATPTRLEVFPPKIDKQTAIPEGIAIAMPVSKPVASPLICISLVGHVSSARLVKEAPSPTNTPITTHPISASNSFTKPVLMSGRSRIRVPKVRARTGPMIGETSCEWIHEETVRSKN